MKRKEVTSYGPTLDETKGYLRVTYNDDDTLISSMISASYEQACNETARDFSQTVTFVDIVSGSTEFLTAQDVHSVSSGSLQFRPDGSYVVFDDYFSGTISYITAVSQSVPAPVRIAQLMLISDWYDQRGNTVVGASVSKLDFAVCALLSPYQLTSPA